jgi:hypothetical protein
VLLLALAGAVLAVAPGRSAVERVLGWTVLASAAVYPLTPLSASGPDGMPIGFGSNLRYLAPVLALALALLPIAVARFGELWRRATFAALLVVGAVAAIGADQVVPVGSGRAATVAAVAVAVLVTAAWAAQTQRVPRRLVAVGLAAIVGLAIGFGYRAQEVYLDGRYASAAGGNPEDAAFMWARDVRDARIATVIARQYPLYGGDLSNRVDFVGERGPDGSFTPVRSCEQWREALNEGEYEYVVTGFREPTEELGTRPAQPREAAWTRGDPAATEIVRDEDVSVFRLDGELDTGGCPDGLS